MDHVIWEREIPRNTGLAWEIKKDQRIRIQAQTIVNFVAFNRTNLRERFDQGRTKANQQRLFVTTGHLLISRFNHTMMTITEDTFEENHDLELGMCSRARYEFAAEHGLWKRPLSEIPTHGCTENLSGALASHGIASEDIPSPFNIFEHMLFDLEAGVIKHTHVRPKPPGAQVTLRAEMDLLAALSVCPDVDIGGTTGATLTLLE